MQTTKNSCTQGGTFDIQLHAFDDYMQGLLVQQHNMLTKLLCHASGLLLGLQEKYRHDHPTAGVRLTALPLLTAIYSPS